MNLNKIFTEILPLNFSQEEKSNLNTKFINNQPFNHITLDNLFSEKYLDYLLDEFNNIDWSKQDVRNDQGIQVKLRSNWTNDQDIPPIAFLFIQLLNSGNFLRFLSDLTGINGLIADPYLSGGGFNQINKNGQLAIHRDGNWHDLMGVHRRLNVILYLNKDWKEEWGGSLELWDKDLTKCVKSILPLYNRLLVFRTDDYSMHGHPYPLSCPEDESRRSLILYYYTNTRPIEELISDTKHRAEFYKI